VLVTNSKSCEEFVKAGGHGAMLGADGQPWTYNGTKDKMVEVLEKLAFLPIFVQPHRSKMLIAPLPDFPFSEELVGSSCLNARSWVVLLAIPLEINLFGSRARSSVRHLHHKSTRSH
jgi:hypothetical protein